ncbi:MULTISPECIES: GIY-YIG nuclease family protein [Halomonadaceae]|nr:MULTISPECIES: GIY-YIG nuclease family protein [Halomonas]QPP48434.1 GIY-YIG nuclease family protein [Halomonas sp. SS10-MC5]
MIETRQGRLYTGITTDVARRLAQHEAGRGAKALRGHGPLALVHHEPVGSRSEALRLEAVVKRLSATDKRAWLSRRAARNGGAMPLEGRPEEALDQCGLRRVSGSREGAE